MAVRNVAHPSVDDRMAAGGQARERTPPTGHAGWVPAADRPDPVALLEEQNLYEHLVRRWLQTLWFRSARLGHVAAPASLLVLAS
jgi:hypothetical protein